MSCSENFTSIIDWMTRITFAARAFRLSDHEFINTASSRLGDQWSLWVISRHISLDVRAAINDSRYVLYALTRKDYLSMDNVFQA